MRYRIFTLGCKVNSCDSDIMSAVFSSAGMEPAGEDETYGLAVINTCAVTAESSRKSRQLIRKVRGEAPGAFIAVCGCFARGPEGKEDIGEADVFLRDTDAGKNAEAITEILLKESSSCYVPGTLGTVHETRTRAAVKIQDGCNRFCSYCIIPYVRGKLTSMDPDVIIRSIRALVSEGFREVVLTGIHIASYSYGDTSLIDLLERIDAESGIERFRLGSLEPVLMDDGFIDRLSRLERLCPHFHLSLQSGSDRILSAMKRRYTSEEYIGRVDAIRKKIPSAVFTTDIIVGFPGETEKDFKDSVSIVDRAGFAHVHIFPYSRRPGTPAASMPEQLTRTEKHERLKRLEEASEKVSERILSGYVGRTLSVLGEYINADGLIEGYSENYLRCVFPAGEESLGRIESVRIVQSRGGKLLGEIN